MPSKVLYLLRGILNIYNVGDATSSIEVHTWRCGARSCHSNICSCKTKKKDEILILPPSNIVAHSPELQGSEPPSEQVSSKLRSNLAML